MTGKLRIYGTMALIAIVSMSMSCMLFADDGRTVIDNPRGGYYMYPYNEDWAGYGAVLGVAGTRYQYTNMPANASKGIHGRLHFFGSMSDMDPSTEDVDHDFYYYPYEDARAFEASELARGCQPFWVTATYNGIKSPVINDTAWRYYDILGQYMNMGNDRVIDYWIHKYARGIMMNPMNGAPTRGYVVGIDQAYDWELNWTGVFATPGDYSTWDYCTNLGITHYDQPFPQSNAECNEDIGYCFAQFAAKAPDVKIVANGAFIDYKDSPALSPLYGIIMEDFLSAGGGPSENWIPFTCGKFYRMSFLRNQGPVMRNKLQIYQVVRCNDSDSNGCVKSGYCAMLICCGPNYFFGPIGSNSTEINPAVYAKQRNALGNPVAPGVAVNKDGGAGDEWLLSRRCEGGYAYFNCSTKTQTVKLPPGGWYNDRGIRVTSLTIPRGCGEWVKSITGERVGHVMINPRLPEPMTGPVTITLSTAPWTTGTTIRYTTDGTEPTTSSTPYTAPFQIDSSCTVKAKAWKTGMATSFTTTASYTITNTNPKVSFHLASDAQSQFVDYYALVRLDHPSSKDVTVRYDVTGGTATQGVQYDVHNSTNTSILPVGQFSTLTIPAGEKYATIHIKPRDGSIADPYRTAVLTLSNPTNATLDTQDTHTLWIQLADAVENFGFESNRGWILGTYSSYQSDNAHWGSRSLTIGTSDDPAGGSHQDIPAVPGASYTLGVWGKTSTAGVTGMVRVYYLNDGVSLSQDPGYMEFASTSYTQHSMQLMVPANADTIRISLAKYPAIGYFYIDDVCLYKQ